MPRLTPFATIPLLALAVAVAGSSMVAAQDEPVTLEGTEWHLVWYAAGADLQAVPWSVDATLRLEDGTASGIAGCNSYSGRYSLEGQSLTFDGPFEVTEMSCPSPQADVEEGYLAALPRTSSWWIDDSLVGGDAALDLSDADGQTILVHALPVTGLTQADVNSLARQLDDQRADLDRLDERVDNVRIGTLRDRIKTLEAQVKSLQAQPAAPSSGSANASAMNAAERVLLEAVPADIAARCAPRRSDNPNGTVAALQCPPADAGVRDMAYYLMNDNKASQTWEQRMQQWAVPVDGGSCWRGQPSRSIATGALDLAGCYVDANGRANLRYATEITNCRQLDAGQKHLVRPAVYIAVLGEDADIRKLTRWAEPREWAGAQDLVQRLKRPNAKWDPSCPR